MRHGRLCFALLTFRDRMDPEEKAIHFSINELAHRVANTNGGRYSRDLLNLLFDLRDTWVRRTHADGTWTEFAILESVRIHGQPVRRKDALKALATHKQEELWLDFVHLNPDFFGLLHTYEQLARFRFDVLKLMRSDVAQCLYAFLPSRAAGRTAADPYRVPLAELIEEIGLRGLAAPIEEEAAVRPARAFHPPAARRCPPGAGTPAGGARRDTRSEATSSFVCGWSSPPQWPRTDRPPRARTSGS